MTGYFWKTSDVNAFGVYTPSLGIGLFHIADETIAPGMKLWSYGCGVDSSWATLSTASKTPYIEIQGGPIGDQSIKLEMKPNETRWHCEYWYPADKAMDIYKMKVPEIELRPINEIPVFGWARNNEILIWKKLQEVYDQKGEIPNPPKVSELLWPPSGIEELEKPFQWAILNAQPVDAELWKFYLGAWFAGCGDSDKAITILSESRLGIAKALLARILKLSGKYSEAAEVYRSIQEKWLNIHPQIVVERDKNLRKIGTETLKERELCLKAVNALDDEWIIERRVQLLIDKGNVLDAKELLLSSPFQKIHQTYNRTILWFQICDLLNESRFPIPESLGEDRLANFGAYREFE